MKKEFEIYQDNKGNVYTITTELEELLLQDFYEAMKRNNEKQERIDKAIVYIENNSYETGSEDMYAINVDELLKILKGDDDL